MSGLMTCRPPAASICAPIPVPISAIWPTVPHPLWGGGRWLVNATGDLAQAAERLARELVERNIPIYELSPEQRDLETVFREVSEGGESTHAA